MSWLSWWAACAVTVRRHYGFRVRAHRTPTALPDASDVAVLADEAPYAYALPGSPGRILVSTGMPSGLHEAEYHALLAHERAHLAGRHHRLLLTVQLAGCANPVLRPLRSAVGYSTERWADEEAARVTGDRRMAARTVGKAALISRRADVPGLAAFAEAGPVPRRLAALLGPVPPAGGPPACPDYGRYRRHRRRSGNGRIDLVRTQRGDRPVLRFAIRPADSPVHPVPTALFLRDCRVLAPHQRRLWMSEREGPEDARWVRRTGFGTVAGHSRRGAGPPG